MAKIATKIPRADVIGNLLRPSYLIEARIRGAAEYVPLERLALSPQCGFASGEFATTMTHAEQEAKLRLVGDIARRVWPNGREDILP